MTKAALAPALLSEAQAQAQAMLDEVQGVRAVVVASVDGFDLASAVRGGLEPARIAALASSIAAIGEVVSSEAGLGAGRCVIVETTGGFALAQIVSRADAPLVFKVLADADAVLAQVKYRAAQSARCLLQA